MNGVAFFLAVNFIIAISFAAVFAVVATRSRSRRAALWFAAGFAVASLSAACELLVAYAGFPKLWAVAAFSTVLAGMILLRVGVSEIYGRRVNGQWTGCFLFSSILLDILIYDLPRSTASHAFAYQAPFALVVLSSAFVVLFSPRKLPIDRALGWLLLVTGLHFIAKATLAVYAGAGLSAADYVHTNYALISQSSTAVLVVAVGLTLLAVLILEIMADERSHSETDMLSGLANRRGFENRVALLEAASPGESHAVILCDLDHFKSINDNFGHHIGDEVIRSFGKLLRESAAQDAVVGRIGGEEFAVFLPNTTLDMAVLFAQALRGGVMNTSVNGLPPSSKVTASFGVAAVTPQSDIRNATREADMALYEAKRAGRNCVRYSGQPDYPPPPLRVVR